MLGRGGGISVEFWVLSFELTEVRQGSVIAGQEPAGARSARGRGSGIRRKLAFGENPKRDRCRERQLAAAGGHPGTETETGTGTGADADAGPGMIVLLDRLASKGRSR